MKILLFAAFACVVPILFTGCVVDKEEHTKVVSQLNQTRQDLKATLDAKAKSEDQISELKSQLEALKDERNLLSAHLAESNQHIKTLLAKLAALKTSN